MMKGLRISVTKRRRKPLDRTCPRGHTWTKTNTLIGRHPSQRHCRACLKVRGGLRWQIRKWRERVARAHPDRHPHRQKVASKEFRRCLRRYRRAQVAFEAWKQERIR
jgi:hypothetical protein